MKTHKKTVLAAAAAVLFTLFGALLCACTDYKRYAEGYTLQLEKDGTCSIRGLPEEALQSREWTIPEKIGGYTVSQLGSSQRGAWWSAPTHPHSFGAIRKLNIPAGVTKIGTYLSGIGCIQTEKPISEIERLSTFAEEGAYFLSPREANGSQIPYVHYIAEENLYEDMVVEYGENTCRIGYYFGAGELALPEEINGFPLTEIGNSAFARADISSITLNDNLAVIGASAFRNSALDKISFGNGVQEIGNSAFADTLLTEVKLPASVATTGIGLFQNCRALARVTIEEGALAYVSESAFAGCPIEELKLPAGLVGIAERAFQGSALESLDLPARLEWIGDHAFYPAEKLKSFVLPDSVTRLGRSAVGKAPLLEYLYLGNAPSFFFNADGLEMPALKRIELSPGNPSLTVADGMLFSKDLGTLYLCPARSGVKEVEVSAHLSEYAFQGHQTLEKVKIKADKIHKIPSGAFENCPALQSVEFFTYVKSIESEAFKGCASLETIDTSTVVYFENGCFSGCSLLREVDFSSCVSIAPYAFFACDLKSVALPAGCENIGAEAFAGNKNLDSFACENGAVKIDPRAFYDTPWGEAHPAEAADPRANRGCRGSLFFFVWH